MTGNAPMPGPALKEMWLYCWICNMSHLMALLRLVDIHAVYLCPNCHTERYVLR